MFTHRLTRTPFSAFVQERFVQVLCPDPRGTQGGPGQGGAPAPGGAASAVISWEGREACPGEAHSSKLFGLAGSQDAAW